MSRIKKMVQIVLIKLVLTAGFYDSKKKEFFEHSPIYQNEKGDIQAKPGTVEELITSESILSREFKLEIEQGKFMVMEFENFQKSTVEENVFIDQIFYKGIIVNGERFRPFVQSGSQNKQNKVVFTSLPRLEAMTRLLKIDLEKHEKFNLVNGKGESVVITKFMKRAGMGLSNGLHTNAKITKDNFTAINGKYMELITQGSIKDYNIETGKVFDMKKVKGHDVVDGQSYMSFVKGALVARDIKLITNSEYKYFVRNWKGMESLKGDKKLTQVFNKFYTTMQMRAPGIKGVFILVDFYTLREKFNLDIQEGHNEMSEDIHYIIGEGGLKYVPDQDVYLQFMKGNKDKRMKKTLAIQTLNSLNISIEAADVLINKTKELMNNVLTDIDYALEFLGIYFPTDLSKEDAEESLVTKVHKALMKNPKALELPWIQKSLRNKILGKKNEVGKYIEEGALSRAKFGEMPVNGNFFFVIVDPSFDLGLGAELQVGEVMFNNRTDQEEVALFRYPNVHASEIVRRKLVEINRFAYLKNVIIFNPFDDTLPRMGGCDTDGDILLIVFDQMIIDAIPKVHDVLPYGEGAKSIKKDLTLNSYDEELKNSVFEQDQIGQITNNATIYRDFENSLVMKGSEKHKLINKYGFYVLKLRFIQGYEIDKGATGMSVKIPKYLEPKFIPTWFYQYQLQIKGTSVNYLEEKYPEGTVIESSSALGHIYNEMTAYEDELIKEMEAMPKSLGIEGFINHIATHPDFDTAKAAEITSHVENLESAYRKDFYDLMEYRKSDDYDEEEYKWLTDNMFNEHQGYMDNIDASDMTKLYVAFNVVANNDKDSDSYYRAFCFRAYLQVLGEMSDTKTNLVPVDDGVEKVTVRGGEIYFDGVKTNKNYEILKGRRSSYKTFQLEKGTYVRAEFIDEIVNYVPEEERTVGSSLKFIGLRHNMFKGVKAKEAAKAIKSAKQLTINTFAGYNKRELVGLFADGEYVGNVLDHAEPLAAQFIGCELKLKGGKVMPITKEGKLKGNANALVINFEFGPKVEERNESPVKDVTPDYNTYQGDEGYEYVQQAQQDYNDYNYDVPEEFLNRTQAVEDYYYEQPGTNNDVVEVEEVEVIEG